ncbi:spore germination protein GerPE [Bacillus sp. Marseille-P3661]|uniref:spore germination protein GerPE n=1 Tax=Bacillus sp. Marseille-P3661 TaxID=1936234 RepID=UPI002155AF9F|nr:spore germination protein GerPE [Bacillus sp. Marseille-P3661]
MFRRLSCVNTINIKDVANSAVFEIGDSEQIVPFSRALAVQREAQIFYGNEGNFEDFHIYTQPIPKPNITENVTFNRINEEPTIQVNTVRIIGMSFSSVFQVGSTKLIDSEARVKHIRQLLTKGDE